MFVAYDLNTTQKPFIKSKNFNLWRFDSAVQTASKTLLVIILKFLETFLFGFWKRELERTEAPVSFLA